MRTYFVKSVIHATKIKFIMKSAEHKVKVCPCIMTHNV